MDKVETRNRHKGREWACQILYGWSFSRDLEDNYLDKCFKHFADEQFEYNLDARNFAWDLLKGVQDNLETLDYLIAAYSQNWRLDRIARVELAILRLSLYEMLFREDIPVKVAINEAIELSKKFGDSKSSKFVNGIMDAIGKRWQEYGYMGALTS